MNMIKIAKNEGRGHWRTEKKDATDITYEVFSFSSWGVRAGGERGSTEKKEERRKKWDFCVAVNMNLSSSELTMTSRGVVAAIPQHAALLISS
jgi:subtilisin-like proprotein convertase family protein